MEQTILYIIIAIIILDFILDRIMDYLNASRWSNRLPEELKGIYDEERYRKSQDYSKENMRFGLLTSSLSFLILLAILLFQAFGLLDEWIRQYTENPIIMALLFFGILGFLSDIFGTPFDIYHTFVIEEKYGFNRTTPKIYITDKLKGYMLSLIIGGGLMAVFVWFYSTTGSLFWLYIWIFITLFSIVMSMFYSTLIVPLFNKQKPLEEGELRDSIEEFAKKAGFKLKNIYVIDGSRRSKKANAYFSGLGAKKRIVLYDTLINDHTTEELVGILAHEIGHYKKKHTLKTIAISTLHTGIMLFLLSLFIDNPYLSRALGAEEYSFHINLLAFGLLYSPISTLLGIAGNIVSRHYEYEADKFAAEKYDPKPLQDALKKLSVNHLSNLRPHPAYVFVHYSHPPLLRRLEALKRYE